MGDKRLGLNRLQYTYPSSTNPINLQYTNTTQVSAESRFSINNRSSLQDVAISLLGNFGESIRQSSANISSGKTLLAQQLNTKEAAILERFQPILDELSAAAEYIRQYIVYFRDITAEQTLLYQFDIDRLHVICYSVPSKKCRVLIQYSKSSNLFINTVNIECDIESFTQAFGASTNVSISCKAQEAMCIKRTLYEIHKQFLEFIKNNAKVLTNPGIEQYIVREKSRVSERANNKKQKQVNKIADIKQRLATATGQDLIRITQELDKMNIKLETDITPEYSAADLELMGINYREKMILTKAFSIVEIEYNSALQKMLPLITYFAYHQIYSSHLILDDYNLTVSSQIQMQFHSIATLIKNELERGRIPLDPQMAVILDCSKPCIARSIAVLLLKGLFYKTPKELMQLPAVKYAFAAELADDHASLTASATARLNFNFKDDAPHTTIQLINGLAATLAEMLISTLEIVYRTRRLPTQV